jgi:hypothetical protein
MDMLTVNVFNKQGEQVGSESINPADFGGEVKKQREPVTPALVTKEPTNAVVVVPLKVQNLEIMNTIFQRRRFELQPEWLS